LDSSKKIVGAELLSSAEETDSIKDVVYPKYKNPSEFNGSI
jgi:hypothetical protein